MIKTLLVPALICLLSATPCLADDATIPDYVTAAIRSQARVKDRGDDARRHPAELMAFSQVKPGDTVVDLIPGAGYFTRIFSEIVGPQGRVYAIWPTQYANEAGPDVNAARALARKPPFDNITVIVQPANNFSIPTPADVIWTSQNYHDYPDIFMGPSDPNLLDRNVLAALKPGGVFVVVDHEALPGSGMRYTDSLHRIDSQTVKQQVVAAGFTLDGESTVLRNPADDHTLLVFDKNIRGHTDQFAFRFKKPD